MRRAVVVILALALVTCREKKPLTADLNRENKVAVRPVRLFYETPDMLLAPEIRNVALPESPNSALPVVVRELIKGPGKKETPRLFPADTIVRAAYLLPDGTVIVDLGGPTITTGWGTGSHQELMAVYSVVETATSNFADARRVRFLVNGGPAETLAGHISLARSLPPMPSLVDRRVAP
ncbi:MAG TPA: GerMN domain-containing protein [Thermoanaerobaculia bacterium]|nr:GerMN domain-containing protein [Thermoanaerobaculia bacterium]